MYQTAQNFVTAVLIKVSGPTKSKWELYKEKNGVTPLDLLNPKTIKTDDVTVEARMTTCLTCPELVPVTHQCKQCGCFMRVKTKLEAAKCPLAKW